MSEKELDNKIIELMKDNAFIEELTKKTTPEDIQNLLASKGITCTLDEIKQSAKKLKEQIDSKELSEDDLAAVSGGGVFDLLRSAASEFWNWVFED